MKTAFLVFMFIAIMPWFIVGIPIYSTYKKIQHQSDYKKAVFKVEELVYIPPHSNKGKTYQESIYAEGKIDGSKEEYILFSELDPDPKSQEELEKMVKIGQEFDVYYNPKMTSTIMQGENLRVFKYDPEMFKRAKRNQISMLKFAFTPMAAVLVVFGILFIIRMLKGTMAKDSKKLDGDYKRDE
jgi:hypothetical protein